LLFLKSVALATDVFHEFWAGSGGRAGIERWPGSILEHQLDLLGGFASEKFGSDRQSEIDPRSDSAGGYSVSVDHDAVGAGNRSNQRKQIEAQPVRRGSITPQQARRAQREGAGANRSDVARRLRPFPKSF
jgi:hypothetical protein